MNIVFKRLSLIAAVFFLLTALAVPAFAAATFSSDKAIQDALNGGYYQQSGKNGDINYVSIPVLSDYTTVDTHESFGCLVYGQPHGDQKGGQYRYLGYTQPGEDYTNVAFPPDASANGAYFEDQQWVYQPWKDGNVRKAIPSMIKFPDDGTSLYHDCLLYGIQFYYSDPNNANNYQVRGTAAAPDFWNNIEQYVHVLAPPTNYAWGIGRMWHTDANGNLLYLTVPIAPYALLPVDPDLSTNLETDSFTGAEPGEKITSTVAYRLNPDHPHPERTWLRMHHVVDGVEYPMQLQPVNGAPVPDSSGYITLKPGDTKIYQYTFTVQSTNTKILSRINPVDTDNDKNWNNNRAEAVVIPQIPCTDISVVDPYSYPPGVRYAGFNTEIGATVARADDGPQGPVDVTVTASGPGLYQTRTVSLGRGESQKVVYVITSDQSGQATYTFQADPVDIVDCSPGDNAATVAVNVREMPEMTPPDSKTGIGLINP